jgi:flagellar assembly factor FliW
MGELICFESRRVGKIEVRESEVMTFEPLPGFPNRTRFVLMEHAEASEMAWLVSIEDPDLAFVVATPWSFFPNYDAPIDREHLAALGIEKREEVELLSIVTLSGKSIFLNLAAPLLINVTTRKGIQVVGDDPRYTTRMSIPALDPQSAAGTAARATTQTASATAAP